METSKRLKVSTEATMIPVSVSLEDALPDQGTGNSHVSLRKQNRSV